MKFKHVLMLLAFLVVSICMSSCKDDDDNPQNPSTGANAILDTWYWMSDDNTTKITLEFKSNGKVEELLEEFVDGKKRELIKTFDWTYSANADNWSFSFYKPRTYYSLSATARFIGNRLVIDCVNTVYYFTTRDPGSISGSGSSSQIDSRLIGTWQGNIEGDDFELIFSSDGFMTEICDGITEDAVRFSFSNGELTFSDSTVLENTIGEAPIVVEFNSSSRMTIYSKSNSRYKYTLTKV